MFGNDWGAGCSDPNVPAKLTCIFPVFQNIISAALGFAGVVALFFIILGGFKLLTSGGDPKQIDGARKTLFYAILGLVLVLLSFLIINIIAAVTGTDCIKMLGFNQCN
jgi:hypothetical protein